MASPKKGMRSQPGTPLHKKLSGTNLAEEVAAMAEAAVEPPEPKHRRKGHPTKSLPAARAQSQVQAQALRRRNLAKQMHALQQQARVHRRSLPPFFVPRG